MAVKINTTKVELKDGTVFRGVKVSARNANTIGLWLGSAKESLKWTGKKGEPDVAVPRFRIKTRTGVRVAEVGDIIARRRLPFTQLVKDGVPGPVVSQVEFIVIKAADFEKKVKI